VATLKLHEQEVCGLKWSHDGRYLASGANDNQGIIVLILIFRLFYIFSLI